MQPKRRAARTGTTVAVALAGSLLAGTTWASSRGVEPTLKERCITTLGARAPVAEPGIERKPRCPTAVRWQPRVDRERAARDDAASRFVESRVESRFESRA